MTPTWQGDQEQAAAVESIQRQAYSVSPCAACAAQLVCPYCYAHQLPPTASHATTQHTSSSSSVVSGSCCCCLRALLRLPPPAPPPLPPPAAAAAAADAAAMPVEVPNLQHMRQAQTRSDACCCHGTLVPATGLAWPHLHVPSGIVRLRCDMWDNSSACVNSSRPTQHAS